MHLKELHLAAISCKLDTLGLSDHFVRVSQKTLSAFETQVLKTQVVNHSQSLKITSLEISVLDSDH